MRTVTDANCQLGRSPRGSVARMAYAVAMTRNRAPSMKRSRRTALVLMGAAPVLLVACSREPEVQTAEGLFTSVEACVDKTQNPYMCGKAFDEAKLQAAEAAPRFATTQECETQFGEGKCAEQRSTGGQSFIGPLMTGFFLSQMLNSRGAGLTPGTPPPAGTTKSEPAFRSASNDWLKPAPATAGGAMGATALTRVDAQPDRAMTVRRGGFGATAARRSTGSIGG